VKWRRDKSYSILPQGFQLPNPEEERSQKKNDVLLRIRWTRRCQIQILDRVVILLSRRRLIGNQTRVDELADLLNVRAQFLSDIYQIPVEAIYGARDGINSLRTLRKIWATMTCGELRAAIRKEMEDFEQMIRKLQELAANS